MAIAVEFEPGAVANEKGDLYGTSPFRFLRWGHIVLERERVGDALMFGWRELEKPAHMECDDDFAWLARTPEERDQV